jgi:hypothetical protein
VRLRARIASNPGGRGHNWVRQRFLVEGQSKGRIFVPATLEDNPYLDTEEYENSLLELLITDPAKLAGTSFDFVIITLDGASLRTEAGQKLVDEIGRAFRNTSTAVILCSLGIEIRSWFLERSGLADSQVTQGDTGALIYLNRLLRRGYYVQYRGVNPLFSYTKYYITRH